MKAQLRFIISSMFLILYTSAISQLSLKKVKEGLIYHNPPFNSCHASTIEETLPGQFMVAAFGGTDEGHSDVCIWISKTMSTGWSIPAKVAEGIVNDSLQYPTWNPVLFKAKEGKLFLFYKVGPEPSKWWGMVKTSDDNGITWNLPKKLPKGILGPIKNKPFQLANGEILSPSSSENYVSNDNWPWKLFLEKSSDLGKTWNLIPIDTSSIYNAIQPSILIHPDNTLQILARSRDSSLMQSFSTDFGTTWGKLTKTNLPNPNSGTDAVTLKNGWHVLVYNPTLPGEHGRAKLNIAISKDGLHWSDTLILENEEEGEFSYPAIIEARDKKIHVVYTYNRINIKHVVLEQKE